MIKVFKAYWKDEITLSRWEIIQKYVSPIVAIISTWAFLCYLYQINLSKNSLETNTGIVIKINVAKSESNNTSILKIKISGSENDFHISSNFSKGFPGILKQMKEGDTITVFNPHEWQSTFAMMTKNDIYQIYKNDKTIFAISETINSKKEKAFLISLIVVSSWIVFFSNKKRILS